MRKSDAKTIVIVDDEDDIRYLLREALLKQGYEVFVAENGLRLIAILRSEKIDAVLLDINMPWLSGYQICRSIKNDPHLRHIKVVYVSGLIPDEEECNKTGCDGIIRKPFRLKEVMDSLEKLWVAV